MRIIIKTGLTILVILLLVFLAWKLENTRSRKISIDNRLKSLPPCRFFDLNNIPVLLNEIADKKTLLIVFNPDCEHCVFEIRQISNHLEDLPDTEIIMITTVQNNITREFMVKEGLDSIPRIKILRCEPVVFKEVFGTMPFPTVFIYGRNKKLLRILKGEVNIELITNSLKSE
jgi:thiol-disulfide isomerase/thioredoxin